MNKIDEMLKEVLQYAMEQDDIGFVLGDKIATRITEIRDTYSRDFKKLINDIECINKTKLLGPSIDNHLNQYLMIILPYLNSNMMLHIKENSYNLDEMMMQARWNVSGKYSSIFENKIKALMQMEPDGVTDGLEELSKSIKSVINKPNIDNDVKRSLIILRQMVKSQIPLAEISK